MKNNSNKIIVDDTPAVLCQFSKLKEYCPNKHGEMCLADLDSPHRCEIGLCPAFQMPLKQRAAFLELMQNED